jgi:hypothetical protein
MLFRYILPKNLPIIKAKGCVTDVLEDPVSSTGLFRTAMITKQLTLALNHSSTVVQIIFNAKAAIFAGSFKVAVLLGAVTQALDIAVARLEVLSGWQASRAPITVNVALALTLLSIQAYQAIKYKGISQAVLENNDEEDEDFM